MIPLREPPYSTKPVKASPVLRAQVERLLAEHERQESFILDSPPAGLDVTTAQAVVERPGLMVAGRYKLLESIGEGGMGTVWVAEQTEPVRRKVALKLVKAGMDSRSVLAHFEAERQALAVMDHPNIAKVFDGGLMETGRPFFAMEYVKGVPITDYCEAVRLTVPERLQLFVQICQAVQHAHQKGIIHRDLKPSNILVAPYDNKPVPKVIDFGLAKALHQALTERTLHTAHEMVLGTPLYMSPEQAQLNNLDVDTRSDIYSLGVLLYELLTGTTPLEKQRFKEAAWDEVRRIIREEEAPRPSIRLSSAATLPSLAAGRQIEPARLTSLVRGDLDWIVMKALEKDRTRRYETANGFADDVERYLDGEPVLAAAPSARYRFGKFVRRHKGRVIAAGLILLALFIGLAGTTWGLFEAKRQEELALTAKGQEAQARERESKRADAEAKERRRADDEKQRAIRFRDQALGALRSAAGTDVEKLIASKKQLSANEREYLEAIAKRWQGFAKQAGSDVESREYQVEGHFHVGFLWRHLGRLNEAQSEFQAARDLQKKLTEQFPDNAAYRNTLAKTHLNMADLLRDRGQGEEARSEYLAAREGFASLVKQFPADPDYLFRLAATHTTLGNLLSDLGEPDKAQVEFQSAAELNRKMVARWPRVADFQNNLAASFNNLGRQASDRGEDPSQDFQAARNLLEKLVKDYPAKLEYQVTLAGVSNSLAAQFMNLDKLDEAGEQYRAALDIQSKLVERFPSIPDYQESWATYQFNYGTLLTRSGNLEAARKAFLAARDSHTELAAKSPSVPKYRKNLAEVESNLGDLLRELGKHAEARSAIQSALDLQATLAEQYPAMPDYRHDLADTYQALGLLLADMGKPEEAVEAHRSARALRLELVGQYPKNPHYQQELEGSCRLLGSVLRDLKRRDEARAEFLTALDLEKKLVERFPAVDAYQIELGHGYQDYAVLLLKEGKPADSLEWFDRAVKVYQSFHARRPNDDGRFEKLFLGPSRGLQ
jgi:serine/threonine protein kinase